MPAYCLVASKQRAIVKHPTRRSVIQNLEAITDKVKDRIGVIITQCLFFLSLCFYFVLGNKAANSKFTAHAQAQVPSVLPTSWYFAVGVLIHQLDPASSALPRILLKRELLGPLSKPTATESGVNGKVSKHHEGDTLNSTAFTFKVKNHS
jgi:hypothetical protein